MFGMFSLRYSDRAAVTILQTHSLTDLLLNACTSFSGNLSSIPCGIPSEIFVLAQLILAEKSDDIWHSAGGKSP